MTVPFIGPSYSLNTRKADVQRSVNCYPVANEVAGGKTGEYMQSVAGLDLFSPVYVPAPPSGLLYVSFDLGKPTDEIAPPAPSTTNGTGAVYAGGLFYETSGAGNNAFAEVTWQAAKLNAISGVAWTLECDVAWTTLPNSTLNTIMRALINPGPSATAYLLGFGGPTGLVRWETFGGTIHDLTTIASGSARTHIAMQQDAIGGFQVYIGGALAYNAAAQTFVGTGSQLSIGRPSWQGPCNYSIDNVRLRLGAQYSGSTIIPPVYTP